MSIDKKLLRENIGQHIFHPMIDPASVIAEPPPVIMSGEGVYVTDLDGRRMIDCQGGLWCVNAGYGRNEIIDAMTRQLKELPYYTMFPGSANAPAVELSKKLCDLTAQEDMDRVIFGSGGSDATESAFKVARQYWKLAGEPERNKIISFRNGYHGLHMGGTSACGGNAWRRNYEPMVPGFYNVEFPNLYRPPFDVDAETLVKYCIELLDREIQFHSPDTVAAIVCEPIQGAGGVNIPPDSWWPKLREVADRYNILLIADEVITGFGRSGEFFGVRNWDIKPDIMCLAKGLTSGYIPLGATMFNRRVTSAWEQEGPKSVMMHGYTYSGHPVACAAGLASVELAINEDFSGNSKEVGAYFLEKLMPLKEKYEVIGDIRGKGLMICIELVTDRANKTPFSPTHPYPMAVSDKCLDSGLMMRTIAHKFIISPPLVISKEEVDVAVSIIDHALESTPRT